MESGLIFTITILMISNVIVSTLTFNKNIKTVIIGVIIILTFIITSFLYCHDRIDPIEIYRGNTELVITEKVVDGIVIERDSIVIMKKSK